MSFVKKFFKKNQIKNEIVNLPEHIAIIMDGNGRWAKKRGYPRNIGHSEGSKNLKKITSYASKLGIKYLTVFAFSTENWKRPKSEVDGLMSLLLGYLKNAEKEIGQDDIRIRVIGEKEGLPQEIRQEIARVEKVTGNNKGLILNIALNYGGRDEIVNAAVELARDVLNGNQNIDEIDAGAFEKRLWIGGIPDPELIIRTSGEKRISNFLLWQAAYSEFWFTDVLWPDFKEEHLLEAIDEYQKRNRRFGGV